MDGHGLFILSLNGHELILPFGSWEESSHEHWCTKFYLHTCSPLFCTHRGLVPQAQFPYPALRLLTSPVCLPLEPPAAPAPVLFLLLWKVVPLLRKHNVDTQKREKATSEPESPGEEHKGPHEWQEEESQAAST